MAYKIATVSNIPISIDWSLILLLFFMISEFGGIGWATEGGWGYGKGPQTLDEFYARYKGQCDAQLDNPNFFGFCYTQLTDVEQEHNGLYYYDRRPKFDLKKMHAITSREATWSGWVGSR